VYTNTDQCFSLDRYDRKIAQCLPASDTIPTYRPTSSPTSSDAPLLYSRLPTKQPSRPTRFPTSRKPRSTAPSSPTESPTSAPDSATANRTSLSSADKENTCFAADELVQKDNGAYVPISEVRVGDRVLSASGAGLFTYADVIAVPHGKNDIEASFTVISTASADIKLTPDHYLMAGVCGSQFNLQKASDVLVGSCLMTTTGPAEVTATSVMRGKGVYTIVTTEEFIVVNGIVASPFSLNHYAANSFYDLFRVLYSLVPAVMKSSFMSAMYEQIGAVFQSTA
jgi:Hint module